MNRCITRRSTGHGPHYALSRLEANMGGPCQLASTFAYSNHAHDSDMERYVDGFVLPISRHRVSEYQAIAEAASRIWKEHGALEYWECVGDDLHTDCSRSFIDMTDANDDETVIFAWAIFDSRQARDAANDKIMADPRMEQLMTALANPENPIIDFQRMAHGGFQEIVSG